MLELVERRGAVVAAADDALQYLQLALPVFRISQAMAYGGNIESAYGVDLVTAPGGLPLRVRIEDTRRDPFESGAYRRPRQGDEALRGARCACRARRRSAASRSSR